jgi:hypothetical protein
MVALSLPPRVYPTTDVSDVGGGPVSRTEAQRSASGDGTADALYLAEV